MWFSKKRSNNACFPIGNYKLDTTIKGFNGLVELSESEYLILKRNFRGEKIYNAAEIEFLGFKWNLTLGLVDNKIYKIAPYIIVKEKNEANPIAMAILEHCTKNFGKPSEQHTGFFMWNTADGNVILQTHETKEGFSINFFETSSSVKSFKRRD